MKRRKFIKNAGTLGMTPIFLANLPVHSFSATLAPTTLTCNADERVLVVLHLNGANDIMNTLVPLDQLSQYNGHRPTIAIPDGSLLTLDSSLPSNQQLGLHPSLTDFQALYNEEQLHIVQGVGYPSLNRSHFASLKNWMTGTDGVANEETGWAGRFLQDRYSDYMGVPTANLPDPLGIVIGTSPNTGFHTLEEHSYEITLGKEDASGFYNLISSLSGEPLIDFPSTEQGEMLQYLAGVEESTNAYSQRISDAFNNGTNTVSYPGTNLGDQFLSIARMLSGGIQTKVFMAQMGGFDNHVNQVTAGTPTAGKHAGLLGDLGSVMKAFQEDLANQGLADKVVTVIFSEFARKVVQNANNGTDHGTLSAMFVVGSAAKAGVSGINMDLTDIDNNGAMNANAYQYDYREVFGTLLQDWLGASSGSVSASFPQAANPLGNKPGLLKDIAVIGADCSLPFLSLLPVELGFFKAEKVENNTQSLLSWETLSEQDSDYFGVEKSTNGRDFYTLTRVEGAGESDGRKLYEVVDESPLIGTNYYRLKQVDFNGDFEYSNIVSLNFREAENAIRIFPNPAVNNLQITMDRPATVHFYTLDGRKAAPPLSVVPGSQTLDISHLKSGQYALRIHFQHESPVTRKLVVNR